MTATAVLCSTNNTSCTQETDTVAALWLTALVRSTMDSDIDGPTSIWQRGWTQ